LLFKRKPAAVAAGVMAAVSAAGAGAAIKSNSVTLNPKYF
jgi:hypothetical protein